MCGNGCGLLAAILGLVLAFSPANSAAYTPKTLEIGDSAPDFDLPGVDGRHHSLKEFSQARLLMIIFTCNHCPTAQAYEQRLVKLHEDYKDKGVALVAISPNDPKAVRLDELGYTDLGDSLEEMKIRAKERNFQFPYLFDGDTQATSKAYGAQATPHVFIFDQARTLRYVGRIDDGEVRAITSHDARNALDALLAGQSVPQPRTKVFGCSTKWSDKQADAERSLAKWDAEAVTLTGIDVAQVKDLIKNDSQKLRLVNVWASWCGQCVAEMPELVAANRMYRNRDFEMISISIDEPARQDKALETLKRFHVSSTNYIFTGGDRDKLVDTVDKQWNGPIPHTILIAPGGKIIFRATEEVDPLVLKKAIVSHLGRTY